MPRRRSARLARAALALALLAPLLLALGGPLAAAPKPERRGGAGPKPIPGRYLVVLADEDGKAAIGERRGNGRGREQVRARALTVGRAHDARVDQVYSALFAGFAAEVSARELADLARDPAVAAVVPDFAVRGAAQTLPWGVDYVQADQNPLAKIDGRGGDGERVAVSVAVLDTGIDFDHPDLNVVGGYNCTSDEWTAWQDDHGHGTHVAGTIAAKDNGIGVVGVAPGASLWAVKVLDANKNGTGGEILCGLDWVARNQGLIDVVNASFTGEGKPNLDLNGLTDPRGCGVYVGFAGGDGGPVNMDPYHYGFCAVARLGIPVAVAAGNDGQNARNFVPAAYNEVMTVSNMDVWRGSIGKRSPRLYTADKGGSNFGADVDVAAPGVRIRSTLRGGGYGEMTGTSMAAPHVAGAMALYLAARDPNRDAGGTLLVMQAIKDAARKVKLLNDPDGRNEGILYVARIGAVT